MIAATHSFLEVEPWFLGDTRNHSGPPGRNQRTAGLPQVGFLPRPRILSSLYVFVTGHPLVGVDRENILVPSTNT